MGRNKKDATQDVLNLYNQMQEDENIESGKEEIKVTLKEIESAKKALYEAKEELGNAYRRLESTKVAPVLAMDSLSDLSFQNLMPTFRLEAALAPKVNMHSSSTESRAALVLAGDEYQFDIGQCGY